MSFERHNSLFILKCSFNGSEVVLEVRQAVTTAILNERAFFGKVKNFLLKTWLKGLKIRKYGDDLSYGLPKSTHWRAFIEKMLGICELALKQFRISRFSLVIAPRTLKLEGADGPLRRFLVFLLGVLRYSSSAFLFVVPHRCSSTTVLFDVFLRLLSRPSLRGVSYQPIKCLRSACQAYK